MTSDPQQPDLDTAPDGHPGLGRRLLTFELDRQSYAFPVDSVSGVGPCDGLIPVPGSPEALLGLAQWGGGLLAVLDLPRLLGCARSSSEPCLVRLAPPYQQTALYLPAAIRLTRDAAPAELIEPGDLVRRVERQLQEMTTPASVAAPGVREPGR